VTTRRRRLIWILAGLSGLALIAALAGVVVLRSGWFKNKVRERLISEVERASGGRVEIGSFDYHWSSMTFAVKSFTIHGKESAGEAPLFSSGKVQVQAKIVSALKRDVDLRSLIVDGPNVNFIVYPDGSTNLPKPRLPAAKTDPVTTLMKLAVDHFELRDGTLRLANRKIPLEAVADNVAARLDYDAAGPRYSGTVTMNKLRGSGAGVGPLAADVSLGAVLFQDRIEVPRLSMVLGRSTIEGSGGRADLRTSEAAIDLKGRLLIADLGEPLHMPKPHAGEVEFDGKASFRSSADYLLAVRVHGRGLAVDQAPVRINGIGVTALAELHPQGLALRNVDATTALGGRFRGQAQWKNFSEFEIAGQADGLSTAMLNRVQRATVIAYDGTASGPVELRGAVINKRLRDFTTRARLHIEPASGPHPVGGDADVVWEQDTRKLRLGQSHIALASSRVDVSGTLGERLAVHLDSTNLDDFLPAIAMAAKNPPASLPLKIESGGTAQFDGDVLGALAAPRIAGKAMLAAVSVNGHRIDRLEGQAEVQQDRAASSNLTLTQGNAQVRGSFALGLVAWQPQDSSPVHAALEIRNAVIETLARDLGRTLPVSGIASGTLTAAGTYGTPEGTLRVTVEKPQGYGERFDRARADVKIAASTVEVSNGRLELGPAALDISGVYEHAPRDWTNGKVRFSTLSNGFSLAQFRAVQNLHRDANGKVNLKAVGSAEIRNGTFLLTNLNGQVGIDKVTLGSKPVGSLLVNAATNGTDLKVSAGGDLRGAKISGDGAWRLEGQYPGQGQARLAPVDFRAIADLLAAAGIIEPRDLPFDGLVEGNAVFSGPVRQPDQMKARLELPRLLVRASSTRNRTVEEIQDLTLRNVEPIVMEYDRGTATVRSAKFTGKDTDFSVSGALAFNQKAPWDLRLKGNLNLAALRDFDPDIEASGKTVLDAQVRGTLSNPQLNGSLQLTNIAANFRGVPTGIDKGNGVILFQNNRAVIQKLTAEVGGGRLSFSGFVGYGAGEPVYRLQGAAEDVRVRTEGVSITVTSNLNLSGTSGASLLSGSLTVRKAGFTPKTDLGGLLAQYAKPVQTPAAPNELLRNMQLDVRIDTAPGLMFQTSLTKDIQTEADLRLRGTAAKPSVLGRVAVNQGEINFFGTNYQINRGDILFLNPAKIEPVLDLDLETEARGVIVTINFNGTLTKLNVSYRSDPPLQPNEIIALLAVGRDPNVNPALASSQMSSSQSLFSTGANSILGQAVAAPVSSRLQRFFGVSRLKIDPLLTDVTSIPQARLTLEQQISKDITLTYITNLNKTQEQIVRMQWDLNRQWSLIAVRDENGLFGIDFQYRRRFK
jgi:translocation and assembly module TamB